MSVSAQQHKEEKDRLDALTREMQILDWQVQARGPRDAGEARVAADFAQLEEAMRGTPYAATREDLVAFAWLFNATDDEKHRYNHLVTQYNTIVTAVNARRKAARDSLAAARERAQIQAAACGTCFMIHRPNQTECD